MPARPPVPGVIRVELLWTQSGSPCANIFHVAYTGGPPVATDLSSLAGAIQYAVFANIGSALPASTISTECICTDIATDSGEVGSVSPADPGTNATAAISAGSAFLTDWQIARRYRGGKPRTYWPAPAIGELLSATQFTDTCVGLVNEACTALSAAAAGGSHGSFTAVGLVCVSYVDGGSPRVDPLVEPVLSFVNGSVIRSQRRRITATSF